MYMARVTLRLDNPDWSVGPTRYHDEGPVAARLTT